LDIDNLLELLKLDNIFEAEDKYKKQEIGSNDHSFVSFEYFSFEVICDPSTRSITKLLLKVTGLKLKLILCPQKIDPQEIKESNGFFGN
jgi:hypothetical protein